MEKTDEKIMSAGTVIDSRYRILRFRETSGCEQIYEAEHMRLSKKVLLREFLDILDGCEKKTYLKEARRLSDFGEEPGLCAVHDVFEENDVTYVVTDFVQEKSLAKQQKGNMDAETLIRQALPLVETLQRFHQEGIFYDGICPENIFLTEDGFWKLSGIRLEKCSSADTPDERMNQPYIPYEQLQDVDNVGAWSEVYSVCAVLYECFTGVAVPASCVRVLYDQWKSPSELGLKATPELEQILKKGLAVPFEERYQSMEELLEDMKKCLPVPKKKKVPKKAVAVVLILGLLFGCVFGGFTYYKMYPEKFKFYGIETMTVVLTPKSVLTTQEYYRSAEKIRERIEYVLEKDSFIYKIKPEGIEMILPLSLYEEKEVERMLESYIRFPLNLTIGTGDQYILLTGIDDADPVALFEDEVQEFVVEKLEEPIASDEGVKENFLRLNFTKEGSQKVLESLREPEEGEYYFFSVNAGIKYQEFVYATAVPDDWSCLGVVMDSYLEECLPFLKLGKLDGEFDVNYNVQTEWEKLSSLSGEYQCEESAIKKPYVCLEYKCNSFSADSISTMGEFNIMLSYFRKRLDMLEIPYAIGISPDGNKKVSVKVKQSDMTAFLACMICDNDVTWKDEYGNYIGGIYSEAELVENTEGNLVLRLVLDDFAKEDYREKYEEYRDSGCKKLILEVNDFLVAETEFDHALTEDGNLEFPVCKIGESDAFTEEMKILVLLLNDSWIPNVYSLETIQYVSGNALIDFGPNEELEYLKAELFVPKEYE